MVSSFFLFAKRYPQKGVKYVQNTKSKRSVKSNVAVVEKLALGTNMK